MATVFRKGIQKLELPDGEQGDRWSNEDTLPVPPERQLWGECMTFEIERWIG